MSGAAQGDPGGVILAVHEMAHALVALRDGADHVSIIREADGWRVEVTPIPSNGPAHIRGMVAGVLGELIFAIGCDAEKVVGFVQAYGMRAFSATSYGGSDLELLAPLSDHEAARMVAAMAPRLAAELSAFPREVLQAIGHTLLRQRVGESLPIGRQKAAAAA